MWALQCLAIFCGAAVKQSSEEYDDYYDLEPLDTIIIRNGGYPVASPNGTNTRFQITAPLQYKVIATCYVNIAVSYAMHCCIYQNILVKISFAVERTPVRHPRWLSFSNGWNDKHYEPWSAYRLSYSRSAFDYIRI